MTVCLIVDDSKVLRKTMRGIIEPLGFAVMEAEEGAAALAHLRAQPVAVVILDWHLPAMDVLACLREIRADKTFAQPKILFCVAQEAVDMQQAALAAGADACITKPFSAAALAEKLRAL